MLLYYSSVEHMYKSQRFDDLLDAIEGSKGRAITDALEKESSQNIQEHNLSPAYLYILRTAQPQFFQQIQSCKKL